MNDRRDEGYYGRGSTFPFDDNVIEVPADEVRNLEFDCILYQTNKNYLEDQYTVLSEEQRLLPKVYLEHDTPRGHAATTRHIVTDEEVTLVHVTHYNKLMWDSNGLNATVIDHGVMVPEHISYSGDIPRGLVVINNLPARGRLLGLDLFLEAREHVPIDLVGMGTEGLGLGEVLHPQLPEFVSRYRFYFHPVRYTSLGLSLLEAMMTGLPVVGLATTELPVVVDNERSGFVHTDFRYLIDKMKLLIEDPQLARKIGEEGKRTVEKHYNITRFTNDWKQLLEQVVAQHRYRQQSMNKHTQLA